MFAKRAQPFVQLREKVKMFEKMSPEMKNQYLFQLTDEDEKKALIELMDIENSKALKNRIDTRLQEIATQQKQLRIELESLTSRPADTPRESQDSI